MNQKAKAMKNKSIKRMLASILLAFESFIVFFATLAGFGLKVADGPVVWAVGLTLTFLLITTPPLATSARTNWRPHSGKERQRP
jgi:hypothetical protein